MDRIKKAAQILYDARLRRQQIEQLPEDCAPGSLAEGYAVQTALISLIGDTVVGWKVGCISPESQRRARTTEPFSGPVLSRDLYNSGCEVQPNAYFSCALQAEFALKLTRSLLATNAPFTLQAVRDAVGGVLPALEIADCRFSESATIGAPSLIADGAKSGILIVSDCKADLHEMDLVQHVVVLHVNGRAVAQGCGGKVMGDPLKSLHWLANSMAKRGESLVAGQLVSTGTCTGSYMAVPGDEVIADYGSLGRVEACLSRN